MNMNVVEKIKDDLFVMNLFVISSLLLHKLNMAGLFAC